MSTNALIVHVVFSSAVILGLGFILGGLLRRLGQPEVIGQIFAGIALGPSILGELPGHLETALIPAAIVPYLNVVSQLALVLFLFTVGYELDLRVLRSQRRAVPLVALLAFALPMILGGGSALTLGSLYRPAAGHSAVAFDLFIAVALSITAVPVLASIIRERGTAGSLPAVVAMTSAGIIDAAGWIMLVAVLLIARPRTPGQLSLPATLALFAGYVAVMVLVVRPLLLRWLRRPGALIRQNAPVIAVVALASAGVTTALGLHVIFGAFLAGLIMPRTADGAPDAELVRPLYETGRLLLPMFFVVAGLPVTLTSLRARDLTLLSVVCVIALVGKLGGGTLGARLGGMTGRDSAAVGVMLNTRGLTELIALTIGLQAGIIGTRVYTVLVVMALLTTAVTGPLLALLRVPPRTPAPPQPDLTAVTPPAPELASDTDLT